MLNNLLKYGAATAALTCALAAPCDANDLAIRAKFVHADGGQTFAPGVVLVRDGKIAAVGEKVDVPEGVEVLEHDGHVSAGLVAAYGYAGIWGDNSDSTRAVLPEASVAHALDADHPDFGRALEAGITTMVLGPRDSNVVGGTTCVVKTADGSVLSSDAHLSISLTRNAQPTNRYPTSPMGALAALEAEFAEPSGRVEEASSGKLPLLLHCSSRHEVQRAVSFAKKHELRGAIKGAPLAGELAGALADSGLGLVAGPFSPGSSERAVDSVVTVSKAGVPVAFALDTPLYHADSLRLSAAMCLRSGWSADKALKALTSDAAAIAGVAERVGSLAVGRDADLVLWSGSPLDLSSRVEAVFVEGDKVAGGDQ